MYQSLKFFKCNVTYIFKILLREGFIENVRKHQENNKYFLVLTLRHRRNRKGPFKTVLNLKIEAFADGILDHSYA